MKIISLVIAGIMWVMIMNIINPLVNGFVNVQIKVENEAYALEQDKTYTILDTKTARVMASVCFCLSVRSGRLYICGVN